MTDLSIDIAHVFRAPVGGLFRHVRDVVKVQAGLGHRLAVVCDATSGGETAARQLAELEQYCIHGIHRLEMSRTPGLGDAITARRVAETLGKYNIRILHGHGAKGGAYARIASGKLSAHALYTPHGGVLHYDWKTPQGALFLGAERLLLARTAGLVFVCDYEKRTFENKIGLGNIPAHVIPNGLWPEDFATIEPAGDASDVVFIGEMRMLKGIDVLIKAIALAGEAELTATLVGDGPDRAQFEALTQERGLAPRIRFTGAMPAQQAFALGHIMAVPSRNESFPYIVLETIAAGRPIVATRVGGIPEILDDDALIDADDPESLARVILELRRDPQRATTEAKARADRAARTFSAEAMGQQITSLYMSIIESNQRHANVA
jgi:glycosyltransferase involved in cell wall biosynthesis